MSAARSFYKTKLEWLPEVPNTWTILRTKQVFRLVSEKSSAAHGMDLLSVYTHIGVRPRKSLAQRGNKASNTDGYWIVRNGDIVVNKLLAWMGAVGVSHYAGVTSPAYDILRPLNDKHNTDYFHFLFRSSTYRQLFKTRSRGIMEMRLRLYFDQLGQILVPVPPREEQDLIAKFLIHLDKRTERVILAKRKAIDLLDERRYAVIHKYLKGSISSGKPSGIPEFGNISNDFKIQKLGSVVSLLVSNVDKLTKKNERAVRLCNYTDVYKNDEIVADMNFMAATATEDEIRKFRIRINDVIITKDSEEWNDIAVPALVATESDDLLCGYHLSILRPKAGLILGRFLFRCLQDKFIANQFHIRAKGVTRYGLSHQGIKEVLIPVPSLTEQQRICDALDTELIQFESAAKRILREIELLKEYRATLVSASVLGQLDVRAIAATLPSETFVMEDDGRIEEDAEFTEEQI